MQTSAFDVEIDQNFGGFTCETFEGDATLAALSAFRSEFRGRGPEPVPF